MGITIERQKEKIALIAMLLAGSCFLTYYFHDALETGRVFTHFFYIPIIIASLWWKRRGLAVAIFLAVFLIFSHHFLRDYVATYNDYARAFMFVAIGFIVALLSERIAKNEEALRESQEQLYQAQKMKTLGTLVAGVAHEINNPINLIMFNIPLLQKIWHDFLPVLKEQAGKEPDEKYGGLTYDFLKENLSKLLSDMDIAANRVARIVMNLKNFARQSNVADKKPIQLNTAVENAMRLVQTTLRKSDIDMKVDLADNLPLMEGSIQSIEQIILNITINAIQAINHDQGKVEVVTGFQKKDERIFLSISDNGHGIDPSISDKIFDPFVTNKQAKDSTGLGLSITNNLVKAHKGEINFQSQNGKGTAFTVYFPAILQGRAARILVVDDDRSVRDVMAKVLTRGRYYSVDEACSGIDACIRLESSRPDLLILDIFMPDMDGLEVCRDIKTQPELSGTKVIVITGFPDHPKLKEVAEMGFTNIYAKPVKLQDLLKEVDNILA